MTKKLCILTILFFSFSSLYSQVINYKFGKYKAVIDLNKFTMKWEKGMSTSTLLEIQTDERNVRKFNEIENGKVSGTFEIYDITDGEHEGTYKRADGVEFNMKIIKVLKE